MPLMNPSTTERATSSRFPMRARTLGTTNRAPGMADESIMGSHPRTGHRHVLEQAVDQGVAGNPFRLRVEVGQHAVAQHRMGERADVVEADVIPPLREGA